VSIDPEFRTPEQEVLKLLEECAELRRTLKTISAQLGRMENRMKRAFPTVAAQARDCSRTQAPTAESSPEPENFFAKTPSTERLPPFWGKPFLDRFLGEGA
jgi:hypothetical protein